MNRFPDSGVIGRYIFDTVGTTRAVDGGLLMETYGPVPLAIPGDFGGGGVAALAIVAAIAIPNVIQTRAPASRAKAPSKAPAPSAKWK